ncbi:MULTISPECIES: DUF2589 domain-containing protein [unclassified Sphingobacterium]|uniref:DUF2589 domain-containing protein n=1 Tax=unclassified Sphingobacterium TaxID=2609468 RepID=UPI001048E931|nr:MULTISPECIES: DUF2589 domain-containing protein [unclassified Sphingobacterium]MCS3552656.1 hypothetical protein [Sphingobacterium sp. JUb21]TCR10584.1 uncharacterized protein DUF2589 [Sphingobacterium sp. JUb20]
MKLIAQNTGAHKLMEIFKAPMQAVIDADIDLSKKISDFIINYGFESDEQDISSIRKLKMVNFSYNLNGSTVEFSMPVLSLIQLPLLRIKSVIFDMNVKLFTVENIQPKQIPSLLNIKQTQDNTPANKIIAYLAPNSNDSYEKIKSNMNVKLNMVDGDMPAGIIQLLGLLNELNKVKK